MIDLKVFLIKLHVLGYVFFKLHQHEINGKRIIIFYILEILFLNLRGFVRVSMVCEFLATCIRVLKYLFFHLVWYKVAINDSGMEIIFGVVYKVRNILKFFSIR